MACVCVCLVRSLIRFAIQFVILMVAAARAKSQGLVVRGLPGVGGIGKAIDCFVCPSASIPHSPHASSHYLPPGQDRRLLTARVCHNGQSSSRSGNDLSGRYRVVRCSI